MIIGVSGKIGSGKDEFFKILNELTAERFEKKKFAFKLKQIVCLLIGCTMEQLEEEEFKDSILQPEWNYIDNDGIEKQMTVRLLLQKLGTEGMRNGVHKNIHINSLFADYKLEHHSVNYKTITDARGLEHTIPISNNSVYPDWCVTDMRFFNEMAAIKDRQGLTVRIERLQTIDSWIQSMKLDIDYNKHLSLLKITKNDFIDYIKDFHFTGKHDFLKKHAHDSEIELDNSIFDAVIYNDGTLEDFKVKVKRFLYDLKVIL